MESISGVCVSGEINVGVALNGIVSLTSAC